MSTREELMPRWTKKVVTDTTGRDPLGLSRVSFIITDFLLTGIITQTDRARYYSFYCWALWHINHAEELNSYQDFVDHFRRREAAFAIATLMNNPAVSPVGVTAAKKKLEEVADSPLIDCDFRVLPANSLGGFGQYYSGSIYQLGLTKRPESGIDHVTEGMAENLAEAFHRVVKDTPYIKKELYRLSKIDINSLKKTGRRFSLEALDSKFADTERKLLLDLFLGTGSKTVSERSMFRRHTIGLVLHTVSEYEKRKIAVPYNEIDRYVVYPPYYFGELVSETASVAKYTPPKKFQTCYYLWRQFCLQQLFSLSIEGLMYCVLETAGSEASGLSMDEIVKRLTGSEFRSGLKDILDSKCAKPRDLLRAIGLSDIPDGNASDRICRDIPMFDPMSESSLLERETDTLPGEMARYVCLLAVLYAKWRGSTGDTGLQYVASNAGNEIWVVSVFHELDMWFEKSTTWDETLNNIVSRFILDQHDRIMYEKRKLDSCWLHRHEGRIFKDQDYGSRRRSSRHRNVVSILNDLKLLKISNESAISLTQEGKATLKLLKTMD